MSFKELVSHKLSRVGYHLLWHTGQRLMANPSVAGLLYRRAHEEAAQFAFDHLEKAQLFEDESEIRRFSIHQADVDAGLCLEFGVFSGYSINFFADLVRKRNQVPTIHGFDSFVGLREAWYGTHLPAGDLDQGGRLPKVRPNVVLHKGWVQDTLPAFLAEQNENVSFLHMDLDTYESTRFVLERLKNRIASGCVILFDEFYGFPNWRHGEYKALIEVFDENAYEYIAFATEQVAVRFR